MRTMVGSLRDPTSTPLAPLPGYADLPLLEERARQAGVDCTISIGAHDLVPESVQLTVYRVVQESITNVIRHAPGAQCRATIKHSGNRVVVAIEDNGPGASAEVLAGGNGLAGMMDRVASHGGTIAFGDRPGGGFRVEAVIPGIREA